MGVLIYFAFAFFIGAVPFAEYTKKIIKEHSTIKISLKATAKAKIYLLLDPWLGVILSFLDVFKAFIVTLTAGRYFDSYLVIALSAFVVVLGQVYSPFVEQKNNKGLGCMLGALAAFNFNVLLIGAIIYATVLAFFHYLRLSLLVAALILPIFAYAFADNIYLVLYLLLCFILNLVLYLPNIKKYLNGEEPNLAHEFSRRNKI